MATPLIEHLETVYACRDGGVMAGGLTRWKPRRVECTASPGAPDAPAQLYVVKYRQNGIGTASLISEIIVGSLFRALGLRMPQLTLVQVSDRLSAQYETVGLGYHVEPGLHFGTLFLDDAIALPKPEPGVCPAWDTIASPIQFIEIWLADSWVMTVDRDVIGNLLLHDESDGTFSLVPIDNGDCFGGSGVLADGTFQARSLSDDPVKYSLYVENAIYECGTDPLNEMVKRIEDAAGLVDAAADEVPGAWWTQAGVNRADVVNCLRKRAERIETIAQVAHWEGLKNAVHGGLILRP